jgi:phosphoribosylanthranilate isomerase
MSQFLRVKICGITQPQQGQTIAALGADALGFICVPRSPRYVTPDRICEIIDALSMVCDRVGVFMDADLEQMIQIVKQTGLNHVQLHGSESVEDCDRLRQTLPDVKLIKAFRIRSRSDLDRTQAYQNDWLLLDAYHPEMGGGTGQVLDWQALQAFRPKLPWFLAGGLTPDNVQRALTLLQPDGIDLSSGVEQSPGHKDLEKVTHLLEQVRPWRSDRPTRHPPQ